MANPNTRGVYQIFLVIGLQGICVAATFRMIELDSFYRVPGMRAAPYRPASLPSKARVMIVFLRV